MRDAERHDWINAIVGTLDAAFHLTPDEQYLVGDIVEQLLDAVNIPDRGRPFSLPAAVGVEVASGMFSQQLTQRDGSLTRTVRAAQAGDIVVSLATWREFLMAMLLSAYPDITGAERMIAMQVVNELLVGIGVPGRAAAAYPDDVIRLYQQIDAQYI